MPLTANASAVEPNGMDQHDLGPLAWVLDELRKVLHGTGKTLRRFARDAQAARATGEPAPVATALQVLPQQLRQAVGALAMVEREGAAVLLRTMEAAAAELADHPEQCTPEAAAVMERAATALIEYLEAILAGRPLSAVVLFPQYRDVAELGDGDKAHPADLWPQHWSWVDPGVATGAAVAYDAVVRARLDQAVLSVVKQADRAAAREISELCLGFAVGQGQSRASIFWQVSAAFFEAVSLGLLPADLYVKRLASRLLMQYSALARGDGAVPEPLLRDLLFFCAQARVSDDGAPVLVKVLQAFGIAQLRPVDYELRHFGRFDATLLAQTRKCIQAAAETWSAAAGGDINKLRVASEQFQQVADAMVQLQPASIDFARALTRVVGDSQRANRTPAPALAMEVATSVLYLQAAFDDLDQDDAQLSERLAHMTERLQLVRAGGQPLPLQPWMEELYGRVSDRRTMGSVVTELRASLAEIEKLLEQYFRDRGDVAVLPMVAAQLSQMRGVLSVLGLEQASQAVVQMRNGIDHLASQPTDASTTPASDDPACERIGNSLGALGFLIDMLGYQPALAKKLFVFDEAKGELRPVMGRTTAPAVACEPVETPMGQAGAAPAEPALPDLLLSAQPVAAPAAADAVVDTELLEIFLEEVREVVDSGLASITQLAQSGAEPVEQVAVRRAFHTLKGSSRMVGLVAFGEAAWSMEQLHNAWLAEQKPVDARLLQLSGSALRGFGQWAVAIEQGCDAVWTTSPFQASADALRLQGQLIELVLPQSLQASQDVATAFDPAAPDVAVAAQPEPIEPAAEPFEPQAAEVGEVGMSAEPYVVESASAGADIEDLLAQVEPLPGSAIPVEPDMQQQEEERQLEQTPASLLAALPSDSAAQMPPSAASIDPAVEAAAAEERVTPVQASSTFEDEDVRTTPPDASEQAGDQPSTDIHSAEQQPDLPSSREETLPAVQTPIEAWQSPALPEPIGLPEPVAVEAGVDEAVRIIGDLRIGIPLYNVYVSEADEWARQLQTEISEWTLDPAAPIPELAIATAHSLGGSSSTVGFTALATLARRLEKALGHVQIGGRGNQQQASVFTRAAQEVGRLLRQFAAGQLKEADLLVLQALDDVLDSRTTTADAPSFDTLTLVDASAAPTTPPLDAQEAVLPPATPTAPAEPVLPEAQRAALGAASDPRTGGRAAASPQPMPQAALDDDIDALDMVDPDLFPIFEDEALELLPRLGGALRQWMSEPQQSGARAEVMRCLHTLKGSARLAGALRLGEMAHRFESRIEANGGSAFTSAAAIEPLLLHFDALQGQLDTLRGVGVRNEPVVVLSTAVDSRRQAAAAATQLSAGAAAAATTPLGAAAAPVTQRLGSQPVRVRAQLLDRLVNQAGEIMMTRARLESRISQLRGSLSDLTGNLDRLRQQLRDVELQAETQMQSRLAQSKDSGAGFDPLEFDRFTRVQELTRMMAESVNDVATVQRSVQRAVEGAEDDLVAQARQSRELQRDLLRTRMVEFEGIAERLYGVVRQAAKETGKQVKLDITGGSIEMDRGMLDRLAPAFEHLLRNAVAHGIEPPQQRIDEGKPAAGAISIDLRQAGNEVSVSFRDDGAGLDLARIRQKAQERQLTVDGEPLTDAQAMQLIFTPGFSTLATVTELAGRGVGMDVVRSEVNALGGRIETESQAGRGTGFTLVLPLTTAVTQVVMLRAGAQTIGVPSALVELVRRVPAAEVDAAYASGTLGYGGETIPFFWCGALLQSSAKSQEPAARTRTVLIIRSASQRLALHVDDVLGNQEVVVKNLGPQLAKLPGLAGMSVLPSGTVALIYNPVALATVYGPQARQWIAAQDGGAPALADQGAAGGYPAPVADEARQAPLVLVVDDSITVRRVTQRLLQREGFRVALAADGLQAIERLGEELPVLVISDIEMPRMDGFDLVRNIRGDTRTADLPIVMITSRIGHKHREHATELGVQHYLGKPFSEEELLRLARHYARQTTQLEPS